MENEMNGWESYIIYHMIWLDHEKKELKFRLQNSF